MKCYNCGCTLSEKSFCTACGTDVALYKKIMHISNRYYNDGLEKANVRDLSGAIVSLRQSLKFNKHHIEARNLLGLIYFETGQVAAALSEWVISKNFRSEKNIADDYINAVQNNATRLDTLNQTIKKYNISLSYCKQGSYDLAVIQLKKVLSLNPRFLEAHQLLALLYIRSEEWEKARKELMKCMKIDANNTTTLLYLKEVKLMVEGDDKPSSMKKRKNETEEAITYQSGNETIIQPLNVKEPVIANTLVNIVIGLVVGIAVSCFLISPARNKAKEGELAEQLRIVSENSDAKTATISELEQQLGKLEAENKSYQEQIADITGANGAGTSADLLFQAATIYMNDKSNLEAMKEALLKIDVEFVNTEASESFKNVYQIIMLDVGEDIAAGLMESGTLALNQNDYTVAIESLQQAWQFNQNDSHILYQLAQAYRLAEDAEKAKEIYEQVISLFPDTDDAVKAKEYLDEMSE